MAAPSEQPLGPGEFAKYHGLGNDYIVLDGDHFGFLLTPSHIRRLCARHIGVGADGILVRVPTKKADFGLRIYNPDGSEAEKSGNGLRIFARCMAEMGYTTRPTFSVETPGGIVEVLLEHEGDLMAITVDMGAASFRSDAVGMAGPPREVVDETLQVAQRRLTITAVSMGNPHCVHFVTALDRAEMLSLAPLIENHPTFARRTNVQWVQVKSRQRLDILIWERGAQETLASGSSSCAAAAAAYKAGAIDPTVEVHMPGGVLQVAIAHDWTVRLRGPALPICRGKIRASLLEA